MAADFKFMSWDDPRWEDVTEFSQGDESTEINEQSNEEISELALSMSKTNVSNGPFENGDIEEYIESKERDDVKNRTEDNQYDEKKHTAHQYNRPNYRYHDYKNSNKEYSQNPRDNNYVRGNDRQKDLNFYRQRNQNVTGRNEGDNCYDEEPYDSRYPNQNKYNNNQYPRNHMNEKYAPNHHEKRQFRGNYRNKDYNINRNRNNYQNENRPNQYRPNNQYTMNENHFTTYYDQTNFRDDDTVKQTNYEAAGMNRGYDSLDYNKNSWYNNRNGDNKDSRYRRGFSDNHPQNNGQQRDPRYNINEGKGFSTRGNSNWKDDKDNDDDEYKEEYKKFHQIYRNKQQNNDRYFEWKSSSGSFQNFNEKDPHNNDFAHHQFDDTRDKYNYTSINRTDRNKYDNREMNDVSNENNQENISRLMTRFQENIRNKKDQNFEAKLPKEHNLQNQWRYPNQPRNKGDYRNYDEHDNHSRHPYDMNLHDYPQKSLTTHDDRRNNTKDVGFARRPDRGGAGGGYRGGSNRGRGQNRGYH